MRYTATKKKIITNNKLQYGDLVLILKVLFTFHLTMTFSKDKDMHPHT